jgi:N-methylhydantoinase A
MSAGWQVGIDIGGTFTDVVAIEGASGEVRAAKVATRPEDRVAGLLAALAAVDLDWEDAADLVHGTTMVTNAIVQDELAEVALVATEGFADTLAIGRQNRRHLYRLDLPPKLPPQVPAERRLEVAERLDHQGRVMKPLDPDSVDAVIRRIEASGAGAVAVALLHAYADPVHEEEVGRKLREKFPFVALSNRVNPEAREYERTATTVLSASVMPLAAGYLDRLDAEKPAGARLHLFHSAGGMGAPEALRDLPLGLAVSGPAAGVAAAGRVAGALSLDHAISFDMGGTTTDVCLITDGRAEISSDRTIAGRPLRQPMVAVETIGAGGGSIARLDHGALRVGPDSAGAVPGPACYGRGGDRPTVSDANLVLGYLDPDRVLGDGVRLDGAAARAALVGGGAGDDRRGYGARNYPGRQRGHGSRPPPHLRRARYRRADRHPARLRRRRADACGRGRPRLRHSAGRGAGAVQRVFGGRLRSSRHELYPPAHVPHGADGMGRRAARAGPQGDAGEPRRSANGGRARHRQHRDRGGRGDPLQRPELRDRDRRSLIR